jgi:polar amino acid transport system ATP-binding protein
MSQEVAGLIRKLLDENVTMVCVTHDLNLAESVSDEVVYLQAGRVSAEDRIDYLSKHHEDPGIRAFFGEKRRRGA